jgi:hypothetical protein
MKYMIFGIEFIFITLFFVVLIFGIALLAPEPRECVTDMECTEAYGE